VKVNIEKYIPLNLNGLFIASMIQFDLVKDVEIVVVKGLRLFGTSIHF